jgi:hypothetical protein
MVQLETALKVRAAECLRWAAVASTPDLRITFEQLAVGWLELASLRRRLDAERS